MLHNNKLDKDNIALRIIDNAVVNSWAKMLIINSVGDLTIVPKRYEICFHILMRPVNDVITDCVMLRGSRVAGSGISD